MGKVAICATLDKGMPLCWCISRQDVTAVKGPFAAHTIRTGPRLIRKAVLFPDKVDEESSDLRRIIVKTSIAAVGSPFDISLPGKIEELAELRTRIFQGHSFLNK